MERKVEEGGSSLRSKLLKITIGVILIGIVIAYVGWVSIRIIPTGFKGVVLTWGEVTGVVDPGLRFITPVAQDIILMDMTIRKAETTENAASSDLQEVSTTVAVNYQLDPGFVDVIYKTLRTDYEERVINPTIQESIKAATAMFTAEELVTRRPEVVIQFDEVLTEKLKEYHIMVLTVSITNFQFSPQFAQAIEAKVVAAQRALEAKNKLEQIRYEAQRIVIEAEAYYNATVRKAEADAEALRLRREQLDSLILQWTALERWDGKLPTFMGSGAIPFIQVPVNETVKP
ncbi:prohibitin family protein [bacterium]|nr:MAG: prohibitin family protein [bacterium]